MKNFVHVSQVLISWRSIVIHRTSSHWQLSMINACVVILLIRLWRCINTQACHFLPVLHFRRVLQDPALAYRKMIIYRSLNFILCCSRFSLLWWGCLITRFGLLRAVCTLFYYHRVLGWCIVSEIQWSIVLCSAIIRVALGFIQLILGGRPWHCLKLYIDWIFWCVIKV